MSRPLRAGIAVAVLVAATPSFAAAPSLPPTCAAQAAPAGDEPPLAVLREHAETLILTDPIGTVATLCSGLRRSLAGNGPESADSAWWALSLAMPLIAYLDRHAEAEPLLEFALPVFERELGPASPEAAEVHVAWAWIHFRRGRLADCESAWLRALTIREQIPGVKQIELQKVLVGLAHVRLNTGDFTGSRAALDRARRILEDNGESVSEAAAAVENVYTNLFLRQEDFASARTHAERQIAIERQLAHSAAQTNAPMTLLGQILERLDEFEESERVLREAVRLADAPDGPPQRHQLPALIQLARLLEQRGKSAEALPYAERGVAVAEHALGPAAPRLVAPLGVLGEVQRSLGGYPEALATYERAAGIVAAQAADVDRPSLVAHHRGFAALQAEIGDFEGADGELRAGLAAAADDPALMVERAQLLQVSARLLARDDPARARAELEEALRLLRLRLPESHPRILRALNELCGLELDAGEASGPYCRTVASRLASPDHADPALRSLAYVNQSRLARLAGDDELAYDLAIRAIATGVAPEPGWRAELQLARTLRHRGAGRLAVFVGKRCLASIESLRLGLARRRDDGYERGFVAAKADAYRTVTDWLLQDDRLDEGLEILSLLKSEEFLDYAARAAAPGDEPTVSFTAEETQLSALLDAALGNLAAEREFARLAQLDERGRLSVTERRPLADLRDARSAAEGPRGARVRGFLAASQQSRPPASGRSPRRTAPAQEHFGPDTALVFYLLAGDRLRTLVATSLGIIEFQTPLDATALRQDVGRLLDGIARRSDIAEESRRIYNRLVIWADGVLRYVPFAALHDGRDYLVARYALQMYAEPPVGSHPPHGAALGVRGFGVTRAVAGHIALPGVAAELCSIVRGPIAGLTAPAPACPHAGIGGGALPGLGYVDEAFTEARLRAVLAPPRDFSVIHLGTHFRLRPGNALRSFLVLGDGTRLTLDRVSELDLGPLDLLTLSACQTGLGGSVGHDGREVEALSTLMQRRGAAHVVASLWRVDDASTGRLMQAFYGQLARRGGPVADALREAQLQLLRTPSQSHPYYWAGFGVSGWRL